MTPSARVLAALGLGGVMGCGDGCGTEAHPCLSMVDPDAGPCLEMPPEPLPLDERPEEAQPSVCLNIAPEPPVAPCLEVVEPPPQAPPPPIGPCLKVAPDPRPAPPEELQPCLDFAPVAPDAPAQEPAAPTGEDQGAVPAHRPVDRVLARGVLPDDVAALLAGRRA